MQLKRFRTAQDGTVKPKRDVTPSITEVRDLVRQAGLRSTAPRIAVYRYLYEAKSPVSHPEISEALADQGFDRATIYRNLIDLANAGILSRTDAGDHLWRFELRREDAHSQGEHPHFTCVGCGTISCLPGVQVEIKTDPQQKASAAIRQFDEVLLKGRCDNCVAP